MDGSSRRPNILHLEGVTLKDYVPIEDVFDGRLLEEASVVAAGSGRAEAAGFDVQPYSSIPRTFTSVDDWPASTNLRCWSCGFTFDGPPSFAPTFVREALNARGASVVEVGVEGNFCTFNCAARYIDDMYPRLAFPTKHWQMRDNLCLVYFFFKGARVRHIHPAPRRFQLAAYGGTLSADEFWAQMRELDPIHGLRDHRLGTVVPERFRNPPAGVSAWSLCAPGGPPGPRAKNNQLPADSTALDASVPAAGSTPLEASSEPAAGSTALEAGDYDTIDALLEPADSTALEASAPAAGDYDEIDEIDALLDLY
jgi:hypothetical protein